MNYESMQTLAHKHNLGHIHWEEKIPLNSTNGKPMEVGYVFVNGERALFCKKSWSQENFRLCNDFAKLT